MTSLIVLRDLPGYAAFAALAARSRAIDSDLGIKMRRRADELSQSWFCIREGDTHKAASYPDDEDAWEEQFNVCEMDYSESEAFWTAFGWDVSDGNGDFAVGAIFFLRQIVAAVRGLVPGASFRPLGDGLPAYDDYGEPLLEDDLLEERLLANVEAWQRNRGRF